MGMPPLSRTVGKLTMWSSSATHLQMQCNQQAAAPIRSARSRAGGRVSIQIFNAPICLPSIDPSPCKYAIQQHDTNPSAIMHACMVVEIAMKTTSSHQAGTAGYVLLMTSQVGVHQILGLI